MLKFNWENNLTFTTTTTKIVDTKCNVASILANHRVRVVQFGRRMLVAEQDLRRLLKFASRFAELLQKHFAQYYVVLALKCRAKYHCDPVVQSSHEHCFVVAIIDDGRLVARLSFLLKLKVLLEHGCEAVAFYHARSKCQLFPVVGQFEQVECQRDTVAGLARQLQILFVFTFYQLKSFIE